MHAVYKLIHYAINHTLIDQLDYDYVFNKLNTKLGLELKYVPYQKTAVKISIDMILKDILDIAANKGLITPNTTQMRDLFEADIMDIMTPLPAHLQASFETLEKTSTKAACDMFYNRSIHSNYIKMARIKKNDFYTVNSPYGTIDITINKSKPEKDPRDIAKQTKDTSYPKCLLCKENVGYYGHASHPGRSNHRAIKLQLNKEPFYLQFSPYVYYNEHIIVFHEAHIPMDISKKTFIRLFDFVDRFPHYFLGSNAGLPIVGGSILSHEHYQGGNATFPVDRASSFYQTSHKGITIDLLNWPLSILKLQGNDREALIDFAENLRRYYKTYSNHDHNIIAKTNDTVHNAINPIVRKENNTYTVLIALRNNRTNETYPDGIFHPHPNRHHIKKENIGLIEVMGLAILPGRLETEFKQIKHALTHPNEAHDLGKHSAWANTLKKQNINTLDEIKQEAGRVFIAGLEDCGVFKQDDQGRSAFKQFVKEFLAWV